MRVPILKQRREFRQVRLIPADIITFRQLSQLKVAVQLPVGADIADIFTLADAHRREYGVSGQSFSV